MADAPRLLDTCGLQARIFRGEIIVAEWMVPLVLRQHRCMILMGVWLQAMLLSGCAIPPRGAGQRVHMSAIAVKEGKLLFVSCKPVIGADPFQMVRSGEVRPQDLPQHERWPMIWRFQKDIVDIVDQKGRRYDPGKTWKFCMLKPSGKTLGFEIVPAADANKITVHLDLVINDRRIVIKDKFIRHPDKNEWACEVP